MFFEILFFVKIGEMKSILILVPQALLREKQGAEVLEKTQECCNQLIRETPARIRKEVRRWLNEQKLHLAGYIHVFHLIPSMQLVVFDP